MKKWPFHVGTDFDSVLGANLAPFWTPRCLQDRRFRPPRCLLFGLLFLMPFWIDFWPLLGPILAPTWAQLGAPKRPRRNPEGPRRPLGPQNPPEGRFWASGATLEPPFGTLLGPILTLPGPPLGRFFKSFWVFLGSQLFGFLKK